MKINKNTWHARLFHQAYVLNRTWLSFMVWLYSFGLLRIRGRNYRVGGSELFYFKRARRLSGGVQFEEKELIEDCRKYMIPALDDFQEKFFKKVLRIKGSSVQHAMESGCVSLCRYFWSVIAACTICQLFQLLTSNQLIAKSLVKKLMKILTWFSTIDYPWTVSYDREVHRALRLYYPGVPARVFGAQFPPMTYQEHDIIRKQVERSENWPEFLVISIVSICFACLGASATYVCAQLIARLAAMVASASGIMPEYPEFQDHVSILGALGLAIGSLVVVTALLVVLGRLGVHATIGKFISHAFGIIGDATRPAQVRLLNSTSATIRICTRLVRDQKTRKALNDTARLLTEYALAVKQRVCPLITFSDQL